MYTTYHAGHNIVWACWMRTAFALSADPAVLRQALEAGSRSATGFVDDIVAALSGQLRRERAELARDSHARRFEVVSLSRAGAAGYPPDRPSSRRPALPSRLDSCGDVAQRQPRSWLIRPAHLVEHAEQISCGPSQEALAVRAERVSCRPSCVPLHSLPGALGSAPCLAARNGQPEAGPEFATAITGLRQHSTPYHLAHGLLDHAGYLTCLDDAEAAAAAIGKAAGVAARLGCQPGLDRAETTQPARPRTAAS